MKKLFLSVAILFVITLSACANYIRSDVTRFHAPYGLSQEKTFVFLPNENQFRSLEYKRYGDLIANEMAVQGFKLVKGKSQANYGVRFNYGSDGGRTIIESDPIYGNVGVGHGSRGTGVNVGVGTVFGRGGIIGSDIDARTEYTRQLNLNIFELKSDSSVFEGTAISRGNASSFAPVSGCLIKALFENFPGKNGATEQVRVDGEDCLQ